MNPPYSRIHEEAFAVERVHFKKTRKRTNPRKVDPFLVLGGTVSVLVAAPCSVRRVRHGKVLPSAEFTGSLAFLLHRETGCHSLAVKKLYGGDPQWDVVCPYKERLAETVEGSRILCVLALLGAPREPEVDVELRRAHGIRSGGTRTVVGAVRRALAVEGIRHVSETTDLPEVSCRTVAGFCNDTLGVTALGVAIHHRFRAPNRNGADYGRLFRSLAAAVAAITRSG